MSFAARASSRAVAFHLPVDPVSLPGDDTRMNPSQRFSDPEQILLWDLDGTLVDTSRDLAAAINGMLKEYGYPVLETDVVVGHVGRGARNLVTRCLEERGHSLADGSETDQALAVFDQHYDRNLLATTTPYPGIWELIWRLADRGQRMAVVTNKPEGFSRKILDGLDLSACFQAVVGGDTLPTHKPDPQPLNFARRQCRASGFRGSSGSPGTPGSAEPRDETIMIGDTWIDGESARAAGVSAILVGWGLGDRDRARQAYHDSWAETVEELAALLGASS